MIQQKKFKENSIVIKDYSVPRDFLWVETVVIGKKLYGRGKSPIFFSTAEIIFLYLKLHCNPGWTCLIIFSVYIHHFLPQVPYLISYMLKSKGQTQQISLLDVSMLTRRTLEQCHSSKMELFMKIVSSYQLSAVIYFRKEPHLWCSAELWKRLWQLNQNFPDESRKDMLKCYRQIHQRKINNIVLVVFLWTWIHQARWFAVFIFGNLRYTQ